MSGSLVQGSLIQGSRIDDYLGQFARWGRSLACVFPRGYRHERWSYERVAAVASQFARELAARGIAKGDAILLWSPNCAEWIAAFLACAVSGVIAVPIDDAASPDFARRISGQVRTKFVVCPRERTANFFGLPTLAPSDLAQAVAHHSPSLITPAALDPADTLEIVFTSGTTAEPKGVVLTHANVAANVAPIATEIAKYLKYERIFHPLRFLHLLPLSHVFGQFLGIFLPPLMGATVVFEDTFNPAEIVATIHRERASVLVAVPRLVDALKQKVERDIEADASRRAKTFAARYVRAEPQHFLRRWWTFRDIHSRFGWKFWAIISGGAALERETEEFWHRLGYAVVQGYGLTETTSLISLNHPFHTSRGSIGKILPGRELKLADDGEILVRGSGVASGYWNGEQLVPVAGEEGWYRTGDLGALDADGNLFFRGRKKEVIVTPAGMNIYPQDLEAALRLQPEVQDCVVVGLPRGGNEEACGVLILRRAEADAKAAISHANETLAEYQRMRTWFVWPDEDFPRTSTGKPRRNVIRDIANTRLSEQADSTARDSAASPLVELLERVTGQSAPKLASGTNLEADLGLSSLERVELMSALEDRYHVDLSETKFSDVTTIGDLDKLLRQDAHADIPCGDGASLRPTQGESRSFPFHYPRWTLSWPVQSIRVVAHYLLARPAVFLLGWPHIVGRENLAAVRGPVLVVANHIGDVDFGFIQAALPWHLRHRLAVATGGEALEALRSPAPTRAWPLRLYDRTQWTLGVALLNLFPLPREAGFRKSFAYAGEAVDRGYSVLVFPEGRHTEDGKLRPFRSGIGLLANNLRIPVVPMRIDGLFEVKKSGQRFASPGRIVVRIGKPIHFARDRESEDIAQELQQVVEQL